MQGRRLADVPPDRARRVVQRRAPRRDTARCGVACGSPIAACARRAARHRAAGARSFAHSLRRSASRPFRASLSASLRTRIADVERSLRDADVDDDERRAPGGDPGAGDDQLVAFVLAFVDRQTSRDRRSATFVAAVDRPRAGDPNPERARAATASASPRSCGVAGAPRAGSGGGIGSICGAAAAPAPGPAAPWRSRSQTEAAEPIEAHARREPASAATIHAGPPGAPW